MDLSLIFIRFTGGSLKQEEFEVLIDDTYLMIHFFEYSFFVFPSFLLGKRVMHLMTTDLNGNTLDIRTAAIESFGKAFLLPFDVLFGWIFTNDKRCSES